MNQDDGILAALPFAAWLAGGSDTHQLRCNPLAAALTGRADATMATYVDLEACFRFTDHGAGWLRGQLESIFEGAAESRFDACLARATDHRFVFHARAVGDRSRPAAVLLLAMPASAAGVPGDWWRRVGHDLRGPVTPVRMALQLLKSGRVKPENLMHTVALADRQLDRLLAVIDDVSDLLGVSADAFALQRVAVDLRVSLDELAANGLQGSDGAPVALECSLPDAPVVVLGDPVRLRQLLTYVIGRVADQAPGTAVRVELGANAGQATVRIAVAGLALHDAAGLACMADAAPLPDRLDMRSLLMREVARGHAVAFDLSDASGDISLSLPLAPPGA